MFSTRILGSAAALVLCAATLSLHAQENPPSAVADPAPPSAVVDPAPVEPQTTVSDEIVVSAHRVASPAERVGSSVTVLTAEEIRRQAKTTVAELLRTLPGVEVAASGGPGQMASVFLRGGNSSHTLVLIDGVRVNSTTSGAYDFANLTTDAIERIEVLRGPQGSLYGSEAIAGVISITTTRGRDGVHVSGLGELGQNSSRRLRLGVDGASGRADYRVTVSDESTDAVSAASERRGNSEDDPYDVTTATARVGFDFAADGRVDLSAHYFDGDVGIDGFAFPGGPVDDPDGVQARQGTTLGLTLEKGFGERFTQRVSVGLADDELEGHDPGNIFGDFVIDSRSLEISAQSDVEIWEGDLLTFGGSFEQRQGGSRGSFDEEVELAAVFVQNQWAFPNDFYLTGGVRHDDHSQFGGETTYRVTAAFLPLPQSRLHGSWGTGFKAPTLNDLFFPFFSNPDLQPETSRAFDLGLEQTFLEGRLVVDVTYFDSDFDDLIAFDFVTSLPQNIAQATSRGVELEVDIQPGERYQLSLSHTWNETEDEATGLQLPRRPEHRSTASLYLRPNERLSATASLIVARDRIDSDGTVLDDYERFDLTATYRLSSRFEPYLRVENLFDEDYEEINGFTTPGRTAVVGLRFEL